ncbi:MAG TPA: hypothetical protein VGK67_19710 [Myxococcales bacterium]|jgi:hypothetical protein
MQDPLVSAAVARSVAYLGSAEASASLARDPYWPKWDSPWWHVLALDEASEIGAVPRSAAEALLTATSRHYVPFFPTRESELPAGKDWYRHVMCHCGLGSLLRVLLACGLDVEARLPWSKGWFVRYQLPDGGFNCDEKAYTRPVPKSSLVSTLPPLEYLLALGRQRPLAAEEIAVLDRGAAYLLRHRLVCADGSARVLQPGWLEPALPRFYEYDALRGLAFVVRWAEQLRRPLATKDLALALAALGPRFSAEAHPASRRWHQEQQTRVEAPQGGDAWGPVGSFALLEALNGSEATGRILGDQLREVRRGLDRLRDDGLLR